MIPAALQEIVDFFEPLPEQERRENLIALAEAAARHEPRPGEHFDFEDVRHDRECTDKVGIFLRVTEGDAAHFAVSLGPNVQVLTRAMATVLCRGLEGSNLAEVIALPSSFVPLLVGAELIRLRSRTVYYMLDRMKEAAAERLRRPETP